MTDTTRLCSVEGCSRKFYARTWCTLHYRRWRDKGTVEEPKPRYHNSEDSFSARTAWTEDGCLEWTGSKDRLGYARLSIGGGKYAFVHRYAWERVNGPIPKGMVIDHLCWNRACANVEHLRMVTHAQNCQNREGAMSGTKSGIRGVSWNNADKKWTVKVSVGGKFHFGGYFDDREEAGRVAAEMRAELMPYSQN